jgi:hypothetical protein
MLQDQHGLALSTLSTEAAASFDRTVLAYLKYRANTPQQLARTSLPIPSSVSRIVWPAISRCSRTSWPTSRSCRGGSNRPRDDDEGH